MVEAVISGPLLPLPKIMLDVNNDAVMLDALIGELNSQLGDTYDTPKLGIFPNVYANALLDAADALTATVGTNKIAFDVPEFNAYDALTLLEATDALMATVGTKFIV